MADVVIVEIGDSAQLPALELPVGGAHRLLARVRCDEPGLFELGAIEPAVALVDLRGIEADAAASQLRTLKRRLPQLKLVSVGLPGDEAAARTAVLCALTAHLSRDVSPAALARAVDAADRGQLSLGATGQRAIQRLVRGD